MTRTRILIIEDQPDLREDIVETLNLEGFEAAGADNGVSGVELIRSFKPDLIVCDITMPEMDGYGVLEYVREQSEITTMPFIFLTARTDRVHMRQGMVRGADDYVTKPFEVTDLLESIYTQLKKRTGVHNLIETRLNELRENIITALPHELRTPLNTILGFSEMLILEAEQIQPEQITDWAGHIHSAAQRLYHLVENYLFYVRLQLALQFPEKQQEFVVARLQDARMIMEMQATKLARRAGRMDDLTLDIEDVAEIRFSSHDMIKVLDELLDNAFKFSTPGTPVSVTGKLQSDRYLLCITDRGRGITEEQIQRIGAYIQFERSFYEQQGMGFGLAIVKQVVELYGGQLQISSNVNQGTQICLQLALK